MRSTRFTLAVLAALSLSGCGYNTIQRKDESVNQAASQIKVQLQRRADLIPNLVETVKGVAKQESTIYIGVAEARSRLNAAVQTGNLGDMAAANQGVTAALGRLFAVAEAYPELKSNENFKALQDELTGTENRIAVARQDYNDQVKDLNAYVRQFPYNITAKIFGLGKPREYFELTDEKAAEAPKVKF
ncbi:MAG TPA: LemA family protein [Gemmatimonadales bacterium]|nr:LemA family protein [Gemmatimonadales bacterium]